MYELEKYLDQQINKTINKKIYNNYKLFGYKNINDFMIDLNFLLLTIYNDYNLIEEKNQRLDQENFRDILINKYKTCIITNTIADECEACHIISLKEDKNYDIDNGILLASNLHKTFDKYYWSINPDTLQIEIRNDINCGTIKNYINNKVNLDMNVFLYNNLQHHYNIFKNNI